MNPIALWCTAALGFLLFGLGICVSGLRFRSRTLSGGARDPSRLLDKLIRAHGNTAEFVPFLAVLFLFLGGRSPAASVLWIMVAATASRYLLVAGLVLPRSMDAPNPLRFVGALGTYGCGIALCISLLK